MFTLLAIILTNTVAALSPQLTQNWVWETKPTVEICPDSNMSIDQVFDAMGYWMEEDVYVTIQRVRKVEYCDPPTQRDSGSRSH